MPSTRQQVKRVLLLTLGLNLSVAVGKIVLGLVTGALSITADGFHSMIDSTSNVVALVANGLAGRPPDENHPYGHQRFETLGTLAIGVLLIITALEVIRGAFERLSGGGEAPEITPLSFVVMITTLAINIAVNVYQRREGRRLESDLLLADAEHTGADIFVTLSVLASMALIVLFGWAWVDTVAALVVVGLIVRAAISVVRQAGTILVDTAPFTPEQLTKLALEVPSVNQVVRARSRGAVGAAYIDIDVQVAPEMTAANSAAIAEAINQKMRAELDGVTEVEVHFAPVQMNEADYALLVRACADALGLKTHSVFFNPAQNVLELHVEVPPNLTLDEAHRHASQLENDIRQHLTHPLEVVTHIEPDPTPLAKEGELSHEVCEQLKTRVLALLRGRYPDVNWHAVRVHDQPRGPGLTMHAALGLDVTVEQAHDISAEAERLLRAEIPVLDRVTIHTEPESSAD